MMMDLAVELSSLHAGHEGFMSFFLWMDGNMNKNAVPSIPMKLLSLPKGTNERSSTTHGPADVSLLDKTRST